MRYAETHKQETRERVLKVATKALREKGPEGVGVADVMREVGLTHGGFYAHFPSKDAFLTETLNEIFAQGAERVRKLTQGLSPRDALAAYVDFYVSAAQRDHRDAGCPLVALNSDLPRQSKKFRAAFDEGVKRLVDRLTQWMTAAGLENAEALAVSTLSAMLGAVALSRAVSDHELSDRLLESARAGIRSRLGLDDISALTFGSR
jgi:TetR/AcrR family transcriptional repressor of nem operon